MHALRPSHAPAAELKIRARDVSSSLQDRRPTAFAAAMVLMAVSGCSTNRFTQVAGQFGALTKTAADQQNARLSAVVADEHERYHASLADAKLELKYKDCARVIAERLSEAVERAPACRVAERVSGAEFRDLKDDVSFAKIQALNVSLVDYADGLMRLAADASQDQQTFTGAVNNLASSLGGLDGAIRKAAGKDEAVSTAKFNAVGTLVAKLANLHFAARRQALLKTMIVEAAPLVERATAILGDADTELDLYDRVPLYEAIVTAQVHADEARNSGEVGAIRSAQDALFAAVDRYNAYQVDRARFAAIRAAHSKLVAAAKAGATIKELHAAIVAIVDLASTIGETKNAFDPERK